MEEPSFAVQQKVLQLVVNRIVVEDHRVIISVVPWTCSIANGTAWAKNPK